ncbi:MAG: tetratricopeptide repeat protein [Rhizobiales bacterium]|nr:tetratricopeptide repeat protein [Hyphomicrobiales bacterium]
MSSQSGTSSAYRRIAAACLLGSAVLLAGCGKQPDLDKLTTSSTQPASMKEVVALGEKYEADPDNLKLGLAYAAQLKAMGRPQQQFDVYKRLLAKNSSDGRLLNIYGKELLQAGQAADAAALLERAVKTKNADWRTYSALGSALDQLGRYEDARSSYSQALALSPGEVTVLNNLGMSYALQGDLPKAEETLKEASKTSKGSQDARLRQNLALVVGLQGRFDEARTIASADLPPEQVDANMAYLQHMLSQPDPWQKLKPATQG